MKNTLKKVKQKVRRVTARRRPRITEARKQELHQNSSESNISSLSSFELFNSNRNNSSVKSTESNFFGLPNGYYNYNHNIPTKNSKNNESNKNSPFQRVPPGKIVPFKLKSNSPNINLANFTELKTIPTRRTRRNKPKSPQKTRSKGRKQLRGPRRPGPRRPGSKKK